MSVEGAGVSIAASLVSLVFAILVLNQWRARRRPYQLAWSIGLVLYAVAAFAQFLAEAYGWTVDVYRIYYLVAAPLVAVLGVGSAFLVSRRLGLGLTIYTSVLFVGFAWVVFTALVDTSKFTLPVVGGEGFPESVRIWSPLFTIPGSVALIGVAAYSYWRTRLAFNAWIAAGALVVAAGGSLARFNVAPWGLYLGELIGIALMFWGFLASQELGKAPRPAAERAPSA